jgi:hypothetical protein
MSRRNEVVNDMVQRSNLYQHLNGYYRRALVHLLRLAYDRGRRDAEAGL